MRKVWLSFFLCVASYGYGEEKKEFLQGEIPSNNEIGEFSAAQISLPKDQMDIFAKASFLYWVVRNNNDEYVLSTDRSDFTIGHLSEKRYEPSFHWRPGVQVALGCNLNHKWNMNVEWTYINGRASGKAHAPIGGSLATPESNSGRSLGDSVDSANNHIRTQYQTFDWLVSRPYYLDKRLIMNPFFGFRGAFMKTVNRSKYNNIYITYIGDPGVITTTFGEWRKDHLVSKTWGIGLRAGTS
ncbi:MAG: Lpg1974 family pore-forming outer membrane protein, partial [Chlamydiota bacterium]